MKPEQIVQGGRYAAPDFEMMEIPAGIVTVRRRISLYVFACQYEDGSWIDLDCRDMSEIAEETEQRA